ncbi:MAG: sulfur oxidation c-type cytochrome SoxA [Sulfurimonas sp.]|nr:sulfur oxidation c-type cytochrome SoxA [Sulfurimonas sp.]
MKRLLLSALLASSMSLYAADSMSEADKALYSTEDNPGEIFMMSGEESFDTLGGSLEEFASFLGVQESKLAQTIATFPRYVEKLKNVVSLDQAIQGYFSLKGAKAPKLKSDDMANITLYLRAEANELPVNVDLTDKRVRAYVDYGEDLYKTRRGKRGLACYSCHSPEMVGTRLRMQVLPDPAASDVKAGATWPGYRMVQSRVVTLQTRMQQCMKNSAQALIPHGSEEMVALEAYVTSIVNGESIAVPGLKR